VEKTYAKEATSLAGLIDGIISNRVVSLRKSELTELSTCLAKDFLPEPHRKQIFLDISELVQCDNKTGIQRVVRSLLKELLYNQPHGYSIEPVCATLDKGYRYARRFTLKFLDCPESILCDDIVEFQNGDIFLGLDLQPHVVTAHHSFYQQLRDSGVRVYFIVYDLLPIKFPKYFFDRAAVLHHAWLEVIMEGNGVICISKAVADEFLALNRINNLIYRRPYKVSWFHLGADVDNSVPTLGLPDNVGQVIKKLSCRPTFLAVGTIEPRKCHAQILGAFEMFWKEGVDINLVIIGKQGWMVETLIKSLRNHPELNKHLFWLEGVSDEYLEKIYSISTCLIAASEGEGFGLPLIEASRHKLPIIARDIPVFHEVAGKYAFYFGGLEPRDLFSSVINWLKLHDRGEAPQSTDMPWLTWRQSARQLLEHIIPNDSVYSSQKKIQAHMITHEENRESIETSSRVPYFRNLMNICIMALLRSRFKKPLKKAYYALGLNKITIWH
jgi:glycosyltransferase involved in cell wall biosynthesis